jgi:hypothetical protein
MNAAGLLWGVLFSSIGLGFFVYGKKQNRPVPLFCGIGLMILPYLPVDSTVMASAGAALTLAPFLIRG